MNHITQEQTALRVKYELDAGEISNRCDEITQNTDDKRVKQAAIAQNNRTLDILYRVYIKELRALQLKLESASA